MSVAQFAGGWGVVGRRLLLAFGLLLVAGVAGHADSLPTGGQLPKLGPYATPIQQSHDYLKTHDAPDYWAISPFYVSQISNSACSLATVTTLLNALRGLPPGADDALVTQTALQKAIGEEWTRKTEEGGDGVTFSDFHRFVVLSLQAYGLDADVEVFKPADAAPATLDRLRRLLADNERSGDDIALVYYNQGVVTGTWDGPHLSPVGAYDGDRRQVLIMDVDREWYGPYWTSDEKLLEAMLRPAPASMGILAGETGGVVWVKLRRDRSKLQ